MLRPTTIMIAAIIAFATNSATTFAADGGTSTLSAQSLSGNSRDQHFGVGIQVGTLSGLTFEYWNTPDTTVNANLTFTRGNTAFGLHHLWMFRNALSGEASAFVPYFGAGALGVWANNSMDSDNFNYNNARFILAAQAPVGMEFLPSLQRFSVFAELAPSLEVTPYTVGFLTADIGARLYF